MRKFSLYMAIALMFGGAYALPAQAGFGHRGEGHDRGYGHRGYGHGDVVREVVYVPTYRRPYYTPPCHHHYAPVRYYSPATYYNPAYYGQGWRQDGWHTYESSSSSIYIRF